MRSLTKIGRQLSFILRHKPESIGITLDEHGWANVEELIEGINRTYPFDMALLEEVVRTDDKTRFAFNEDKTKIRANQGHSISVDVELKEATPPPILYHGTAEKYVDAIEESGLLSRSRLYVHLSRDLDTAIAVGKRHGSVVVYLVDAARMFADGYLFYLSANGVWLTKSVPKQYLKEKYDPIKS